MQRLLNTARASAGKHHGSSFRWETARQDGGLRKVDALPNRSLSGLVSAAYARPLSALVDCNQTTRQHVDFSLPDRRAAALIYVPDNNSITNAQAPDTHTSVQRLTPSHASSCQLMQSHASSRERTHTNARDCTLRT